MYAVDISESLHSLMESLFYVASQTRSQREVRQREAERTP
jgi:hypothetical protein